jgi:peptidoglycan/xylan/chitin deacetylase (PgdA/CDA1 family)
VGPRTLCCALAVCLAGASARAYTPFNAPMVTITLDDGYQSQFDLARPALNQRGLKSTYFLISQPIQQSWSGYLTLAEAKTLAAEGNEIGDHTVTHPHLPQLSVSQIDAELTNSKSWLQTNLGVPNIPNFASPYGEYNDTVISRIQRVFGSHRTQDHGNVFAEDDRYRLRAFYVRDTTTVGDIEAWIDEAIVEGSWVILTFHEFTTGTPTRETQFTASNFAAVLDYLKSRGVQVVTVAQGVSQLGTTQDLDPKRWVFGDYFGNNIEDWSWATLDFRSTAVPPHDGRTSIAFEPDNWGGLALHFTDGLNPATWPTLELWLNGGTSGGQKVQLSFHNGNTKLGSPIAIDKLLGHPIAANTWQKVTLPLASVGVTSGTVGEIYLEDTTGGNQPTLYVDGVVMRKPGSTPTPDAGTPAPDAGTPTPDAGTPPPDAGTPDAGTPTPDAGTPTPDAGTPTPDAGTPTPDAGTPTPDAGTPTPDAGTSTPDAGTATPPFVIYDDALRNGFEDWSWATHNLAATTPVHSGSRSISFEPDNWAGLYFHHAGVDTSAYHSVDLWVNGGATGGEDLIVAGWDGNTFLGQADIPAVLGHALRPNTWEHVTIPLSAIGLSGRPLRDLYVQDNSGANQPTTWVDDVKLVP